MVETSADPPVQSPPKSPQSSPSPKPSPPTPFTPAAEATSPPPTTTALPVIAADEAGGDALEADEGDSFDGDSAFGNDDQISEKTSLFSDIMKYREENGRRYHGYKDGAYLLPNDETEQNRLDLHHHIFTVAEGGKLYQAPIKNPARVLDIGTGTGIWAMDFADTHPESHIIGTDLSPIQPTWVAPNVEFLVDDAEDEWLGQPYDYIHIRMLSGAIKDWPGLLAKAYANLNPGGYLEVTEFEVILHSYNDTLSQAPESVVWQEGLKKAGDLFGRRMDVAVHLEEWLKDAGLHDVTAKKTLVPSNPWPKDKELKLLGAYQLLNMLDATSSYGQAHFTRVLGWDIAEYEVLKAKVKTQLKDRRYQFYSDLYTVYGHKPGNSDTEQ